MRSVKECSEDIRRVERKYRDHSNLQEQQTDNETIGTTIAIMLEELDNLEPDETANLERNVLKKHLGRLIKVARFSSRTMNGLREEIQQKNELIKSLQGTVGSALLPNLLLPSRIL